MRLLCGGRRALKGFHVPALVPLPYGLVLSCGTRVLNPQFYLEAQGE